MMAKYEGVPASVVKKYYGDGEALEPDWGKIIKGVIQDKVRSEKALREAAEVLFEMCWYQRHVESGRCKEGEPAALAIEKTHGNANLESLRNNEYISGQLAGLRWVLGSEWGNSDT